MRVEIAGYAWLDRSTLTDRQVSNIVTRLTIQPKQTSDIAQAETPAPIHLYRLDEARNMLGVPRGFYRHMGTGVHDEVLKVGWGAPMRKLETTARFEGPYAEQVEAIEALLAALHPPGSGPESPPWGGALLQAQPAFGKTACALEVARRLGRRTLILVHQEFFLDQWRKRIQQFLPEARIGIIQQDSCEYARTKTGEAPDFVIGLLQSLARDTGDRYPKAMYAGSFGLVISDEAHRLGAASWSDVIPKFDAAYRLALTATPRRKDGAEDVFFHHISPVTYRATTESVKPKLRKIITTTELRAISRGEYRVPVDQLNSAQIINQVCLDTFRTQAIVDDLVQAVQIGRKIMVVSARLDHLRDMADRTGQALFNLDLPFVPIQDFYTGQWFSHDVWDTTTKAHRKGDPKMVPREQADLDRAERANVIFATQQMVLEGLDIPALDVLLLATPISDVEQAAGRVRRWCLPEPNKCEHYCPWRAGKCKGKPTPIIVDVMDLRIPRLKGMAARREKFYKTCCTM
jgi:superfamily II DNA or RNA helicase